VEVDDNLTVEGEVECKTGDGTYQNLKTKITEIEGEQITFSRQIIHLDLAMTYK